MQFLKKSEKLDMTKVQAIWDEVAEDDSRKVYYILGVYSLKICTGTVFLKHRPSSELF